MARTVAVGAQYFEEIREEGCFYIDKTDFIKEWWENRDRVTLVTRPRRFGKTLALSMLDYFFSMKHAGRGDLFEGLSIWNDKKYREMQGSYPVIFLSFANIKADNYLTVREDICQLLAADYAKYEFLLDSGVLAAEEKNFFKSVTAGMSDSVASVALMRLSEYLYRYYGKKVMILLDEYDTPMQEAYVYGYWNEMVNFTRRFFDSTFKTNPYLERGLMTGITRISKESVFSGLNNLEVVTTTSEKYAASFGFTEREVYCALEEFGLQDTRKDVKEWYDGFKFGEQDHVYNPWSIINYLDKRKLKDYWVNTSSNELVSDLIRKGNKNIKIIMEDLLQGKPFYTCMDEEIIFSQLDYSENAVWSLFLAGGYLKVVDHQAFHDENDMDMYTLMITNLEVKKMLRKMIRGWFSLDGQDLDSFSDALIAGDTGYMNEYLNDIMYATLSCYDTGREYSRSRVHENFYHGFVLGLVADLRSRYVITSNRESGLGRYDVMLKPRSSGDGGIILEFKVLDPDREESLQETAGAALRQIVEKGYAGVLEEEGVPTERISIYGFAFSGRKVLVDGGCMSDYSAQVTEG